MVKHVIQTDFQCKCPTGYHKNIKLKQATRRSALYCPGTGKAGILQKYSLKLKQDRYILTGF